MIPEVGLELLDPVARTRTLLVATAASTGGAHVEVEVTYPPHSAPLPLHTHPQQAEHSTVLAARLHVVLGDVERDPDVGDALHVPVCAPHQMHAAADVPTTVRSRTLPALHTDQLLRDLWQVAQDSGFEPDPLAAFAVVQRSSKEFCLCSGVARPSRRTRRRCTCVNATQEHPGRVRSPRAPCPARAGPLLWQHYGR